jgi:hypothetical protein
LFMQSDAEGEGFEPSVDRKAHNGFRDRGNLLRVTFAARIELNSPMRAHRRTKCNRTA